MLSYKTRRPPGKYNAQRRGLLAASYHPCTVWSVAGDLLVGHLIISVWGEEYLYLCGELRRQEGS